MKLIRNLQQIFQGMIRASTRYPLTVLFLLALAILNGVTINQEKEVYTNYLFTLFVGAVLSGVAQQLYERFFHKQSQRFMLMAAASLITIGYYFIIPTANLYDLEVGIKTSVFVFALVLLYILIPTIKTRLAFNESFMAAFKAFFITSLFTVIIAMGTSSILFAIDRLLFPIDDKLTLHVLNIIFSLFAPLYYLSFTPLYEKATDKRISEEDKMVILEKLKEATSVPKVLELLISYVIIPLTVIYTAILLAYIVLNIRSSFWTDNLLEPLLVSYAVTVILVYILSSTIENQFAVLFRKVFPKVLIPIVLFQTIASVLKIGELGITQGRYYVILFGVFATIAGLIFSFLPVKKNGIAIAVLISFCILSIIPPIDAFTVSRVNQTNLLENILVDNEMLEKDKIIPNASISKEDKIRITGTSDYLVNMNYASNIEWLPDDLTSNNKFETTFGFAKEYENQDIVDNGRYVSLNYEEGLNLSIEDYDQMIRLRLYDSDSELSKDNELSFEKEGSVYILVQQQKDNNYTLILKDEQNNEQIKIEMQSIFDKLLIDDNVQKEFISVDEATIIEENQQVKLKFIVESMNVYDNQYNADLFLFIKIK
ncbi:DUF4153 domain-containing protein [Carnobacterium funditum]|uniref:DUF4153 domain-containing protein n=1 Tax=Carnobacterium funditum TaxID=2752 RepID=UPI0005599D46|nr:DUF4153 domain-containing protein [Carnobacterium funditum]